MKTTIAILYLLAGAAAAVGLVSAYGSLCPTLNPPPMGPLSIMKDLQIIFFCTTGVTWLTSFAWLILIWALWTRKAWFYNAALITAIAGFLSGLIPAVLVTMNGISFSPSWMRTVGNLIIIFVLLIPIFKNGIKAHIAEKDYSSTVGIGSEISSLAFVLLGFGLLMIVQPFIMPVTHIIDGVNVGYEFEALQFYGGLFCILAGVVMRVSGYFLNIVYSSKVTPSKV
ncbi:MAG: hypothetical protein ACFFD4_10125 [Candidatus Odinarchaeota archaeon]